MLLTPLAGRCRLLAQTVANGRSVRHSAIVATRANSTETASASVSQSPSSSPPPPSEPEHIRALVDQIGRLKLHEVAILNEALKRELKIPDVQRVASVVANAPAAGEGPDGVGAGEGVKSSFTLKLVKFDDTKKVALIKEIKKLVEGINLVEAKRYVEDCPRVIKANLSKDEAEALQKQLEAAGGVVKLE